MRGICPPRKPTALSPGRHALLARVGNPRDKRPGLPTAEGDAIVGAHIDNYSMRFHSPGNAERSGTSSPR